ncbi:MAG: phytoene/squalene synthase family protein [Sphaerochaetaceae bacterium]|nr:phytoene/squalene synthase family protein [Sphaerochaetaceae bacterium]
MLHEQHEKVFRKGSTTYYFSSFFFPKKVRQDVYILYGFVRIADNLVDDQPVESEKFKAFVTQYYDAKETGIQCGNPIIDSFIDLEKRKQFDPAWTKAFLDAMERDLGQTRYETLDDTLSYIYGSAEVIGLCMSRILDLPEQSLSSAAMLGRAMQYINFIRDIEEDNTLSRRYLPLEESSLGSLHHEEVIKQPTEFSAFILKQLQRYASWQKEAAKGYKYIPRRYRIPIMTAADMYCWTAKEIKKNPMIIFDKKVKPSKIRILMRGIFHIFSLTTGCGE